MSLDSREIIQNALVEFQTYLSDKVPKLELINAVNKDWSTEEYKQHQKTGIVPQGFPSKLKGVYVLFDWNEQFKYIGVATYNYDKRVWTHDKHFEEAEMWRGDIDIIPLSDEFSFIAPSLEYYLITRLKPSLNSTYKNRLP